MKKLIIISAIALLAVGCNCQGCKTKECSTTENTTVVKNNKKLVGGYAAQRDVTPEDSTFFEGVIAKSGSSIQYTAQTVSKQVVAGTNYKFICEANDPATNTKYSVEIVIYKPLPNQGDAKISSIEKL